MYDFVDERVEIESEQACEGAGDVVQDGGGDLGGVGGVGGGVGLNPEMRRVGEFSIDLHGKSHPDALYRAAGGDGAAGAGRRMQYGCPCCGRSVGRVIRVRATTKSAWMAVCAMCAAAALDKYPDALIGGLVRGGRRRRGGNGGNGTGGFRVAG